MSELKEYVVTVKSKSDIDSLYDDMESENGNDYIPKRKVDIAQLREISRSTHYYLTSEEAEQLKNDNRILDVELLPSARGFKPGMTPVQPGPLWIQTANFQKNPTIDTNDKNWALDRVTRGSQLPGWGNSTTDYWNGTAYADFTQTNQTAITTSSGKNVDVVMVDVFFNGNHPEFAVNSDGTGGTRGQPTYDWFQLSYLLGYSTPGYYQFESNGSHGTHVASSIAGNTQGWARDANIFYIDFDYKGWNKPSGDWWLYIYDYIRTFHRYKQVNRETGRRNPTIVNNSWGIYSYVALNDMTSINYRGTNIDLTGKTESEKKTILEQQCGCFTLTFYNHYYIDIGYISSGMQADIEDLINDGIIIVAGAGNSYAKMSKPGDLDYNNTINYYDNTLNSNVSAYYCRGSSPAVLSNVICVGATNATRWDMKASYSNYGSRVDLYAPGSNIVGAAYDLGAGTEFGVTMVSDPRNDSYKLISISGTSMSCAQVTGVLACLLEQWPSLTQAEAIQYLKDNCTNNQLLDPQVMYPDTSLSPSPYNGLGEPGTNSNNRYLYYKKERQTSGNISSKNTYKLRLSNGNSYPRQQIRKYG